MNKETKLKIKGATISGTGLGNTKNIQVIAGSKNNGYSKGTLMDANAIKEITENIEKKIDISDESINTVKEVYNFLDDIQDSTKLTDVLATATPRTKVTYAELMELADNYRLIPGREYQITDYELTVNPNRANDIKSGPGQFDLILTANTEDILDEHGRATWHEGDEYFYDQKIDQWEIWYNAYNDYRVYPWCDYNGKGVIYRMIDESGNDIPYDFKHMMFSVSSTYYFGYWCLYEKDWTIGSMWKRTGDYASPKWVHTFSSGSLIKELDGSLWTYSNDTLIAPLYTNIKVDRDFSLSGINPIGSFFGYNVFFCGCSNIHLGAGSYGNIFVKSANLECGKHCIYNTFTIRNGQIGQNVYGTTYTARRGTSGTPLNLIYNVDYYGPGYSVYIDGDCENLVMWYAGVTGNGTGLIKEQSPSNIVLGKPCCESSVGSGIRTFSYIDGEDLRNVDSSNFDCSFVYTGGDGISVINFDDINSHVNSNPRDELFWYISVSTKEEHMCTVNGVNLSYYTDYNNQPFVYCDLYGIGRIADNCIYFDSYILLVLDADFYVVNYTTYNDFVIDLYPLGLGEVFPSGNGLYLDIFLNMANPTLMVGKTATVYTYSDPVCGTIIDFSTTNSDEVCNTNITLAEPLDDKNLRKIHTYNIYYSSNDYISNANVISEFTVSTNRMISGDPLRNIINADSFTYGYSKELYDRFITNILVGDVLCDFSVLNVYSSSMYIVTVVNLASMSADHVNLIYFSKICNKYDVDPGNSETFKLYSDILNADPDSDLNIIGIENIEIGYGNKVVESLPSTPDEHTIYFIKETTS